MDALDRLPKRGFDLGIADEEDSGLWMKIHRLSFEIGGQQAPAGYRARMPGDTFDHPPVQIEGVTIRVASPLALYQMRDGARRGGLLR